MVLVVALALTATSHVLVRTATYGAAVGHDQAALLSTAENLAAGNGLVQFSGKPLHVQQPFYSLALALPIAMGGEPAEVGRWLNAVSFGLIVCIAGLWLRANIRSPLLIVGATALVAAAPDLNGLAANLRADILFALLTLVALTLVAAFLRNADGGRAWWILWAATFFAALAALTRHAGVALIAVAATLVLARPGVRRVRFAQALAFSALAATPTVFVALRDNFGPNFRALFAGNAISVVPLLRYFRDVLLFWGLPANLPAWAQCLFLAGIGMAASCLLVLRWRARDRDNAARRLLFDPIGLFAMFVVAYLGFHLWTTWTSANGSSYWNMKRYLAAIYPPLVCLAALCAQRLLPAGKGRGALVPRALGAGLTAAALLHLGVAARANAKETAAALKRGYTGASYNCAVWKQSATLNYLRAHPPPAPVFSVDHALLWWHSGSSAAEARHRWAGPSLTALVDKLQDRPRPAYFVWVSTFHGHDPAYNQVIHLMPGWETVARLADGGVYRVPAKWKFDADEWRRRLKRNRSQPS